ncbi:hypothetical protein DSO57_1009394 [Entomophthora muscae]|uniref:Uncharacterized protein n=1 Tax=Entomophthora muscae TaxID=34485 RepID=A0ACC2T6Z3_9FUNG|nr:hypothetical protein DSO57_1009394 [Entomophthora muscae]
MDTSEHQNLKRDLPLSPSKSPKKHQGEASSSFPSKDVFEGLNNLRIKREAVFEDIFLRYGRDFGDEADEIDIFQEMIVVDRGFIRNAPPRKFGRGELLLGYPDHPATSADGSPQLTPKAQLSSLIECPVANPCYEEATQRLATFILEENEPLSDVESIHSSHQSSESEASHGHLSNADPCEVSSDEEPEFLVDNLPVVSSLDPTTFRPHNNHIESSIPVPDSSEPLSSSPVLTPSPISSTLEDSTSHLYRPLLSISPCSSPNPLPPILLDEEPASHAFKSPPSHMTSHQDNEKPASEMIANMSFQPLFIPSPKIEEHPSDPIESLQPNLTESSIDPPPKLPELAMKILSNVQGISTKPALPCIHPFPLKIAILTKEDKAKPPISLDVFLEGD